MFGRWQSIWTWHRRVSADGTWDVVLARLLATADEAGMIDWAVAVDSTIVRAHQHATHLTRAIRPIRVEPPAHCCGGAALARRSRNRPTRSPTAHAGAPAGGRPPAFDAKNYKGRNVVERNFNDVKQWRGRATRYDKLAIVYRAAAVLRAVTLWLPHLSDTP